MFQKRINNVATKELTPLQQEISPPQDKSTTIEEISHRLRAKDIPYLKEALETKYATTIDYLGSFYAGVSLN